ncbi:MAG: NAD(P)-binding domain-containing protein, partial [Reyranella sp.]|nr:NAD(P)-binding domain-containing protein [Reyranella sp.]
MQLGMIGLGRMGANLVRRLVRQGHDCVVFDQNPETVSGLVGQHIAGAADLSDLVAGLARPRNVWVMLPAGEITEQTVAELGRLLEAGDTIIDGGNAFFQDDVRRAREMKEKGIHYLDCGTSGGVWGLERGYCLMIGGDKEAVERLDPIFAALSPGDGTIPKTPRREARDPRVERGYLHCGPSGAGHFVKMVH